MGGRSALSLDSLPSRHQRLLDVHGGSVARAADRLLSTPTWSLQAPVVLIHDDGEGHTGRASLLAVGTLAGHLEHLPPELDTFVRLRQQGMALEPARQRCLQEQGETFRQAWDRARQGNPLVSHDDLARFARLSQRGFGCQPRELLVVVAWPRQVTAFLVACTPRS